MAQALPFTKLASLLVKTLAKPLSKRIKQEFSRYSLTKRMLVSIGQTSHTVTSRMQIWSSGYRVRSITPLEESKALKTGAEFVGEAFIFSVSGGIVIWEYNRSQTSNALKKQKEKDRQAKEHATLQAKLNALDVRLKAVEAVVKENSQSILGLGSSRYIEPSSHKLVPIDDDDEEDHDEKPDTTKTTNNNNNSVQKATATKSTSSATTTPTPSSSSSGTNEQKQDGKPWWKIW